MRPFSLVGGALVSPPAGLEALGPVPALEAELPGAVLSPVGVLVPDMISSGARMEKIASEEGF